jgi:hypothetical protein
MDLEKLLSVANTRMINTLSGRIFQWIRQLRNQLTSVIMNSESYKWNKNCDNRRPYM